MINLLPKEAKQSLRAARLNVVLRRYLLSIGAATIFMLAIFGVGYYITMTDRNNAKQELADLEQASAKYSETKRQAEEFEKSLKTAKSILSSEVIFSDLVVAIAKTLPNGTVLTDLSVTTDSFGQETTLSARTRDPEGGLRLKTALQDSPLFDKVSIQTITNPARESNGQDNANSGYPYLVVMNVTIQKPDKKQLNGESPS